MRLRQDWRLQHETAVRPAIDGYTDKVRPLNPEENAACILTTASDRIVLPHPATMTRTVPPFRADHVGSLLRPAPLKEARARRERGEISAELVRR